MKKCQFFFATTFVVITSMRFYFVINNITTHKPFMRHDKTIRAQVESTNISIPNSPFKSNSNSNTDNSSDNTRNEKTVSKNEYSDHLSGNSTDVVSRKKRYILFPDGSTFTAAVCSTQTVIGSVTGTAEYTESFVWALVYDLPSTLQEFGLTRKRRDVHRTMAQLLNRAKINGEDCVLKSMCEIQDALTPKQGIAEEILRILFTVPEEEQGVEEAGDRTLKGYRECDVQYPACPVSLLQMLLGLQVESVQVRR